MTAAVERYGAPTPTEVAEASPSVAAQLLSRATWLTMRIALGIGSRGPNLPLPYGAIDMAARAVPRARGARGSTVKLPHCRAALVRAPGVAEHTGRVVLYLHGGGFFCCGLNTHANIITRLSRYADAPVLAVDYRMIPKHSLDDALNDCRDAYARLRQRYRADQIVLAGDSAGGYLALTLAQQLWYEREKPAAMTLMSPLLQLDPGPKCRHYNVINDSMFPPSVFGWLHAMLGRANHGRIYEPLNHIPPDLPPTLIHVSDSEVLLHDARLAASRLAAVRVPVELRTWPGQIHVFQIAAGLVPEAERSLRHIGAYIREATS